MRDRSGALPTRPTPRADDPRTAPLPPAAQAALARLERALRTEATR
jgi:hypothetical protein